jgi:4-hydroxy-3-methylbut-2-en-1-yl diphosphate reductase
VGLTAGASAPEELILSVIAALRKLDDDVEVTQLNGIQENLQFRLPAELREPPLAPATGPLAAQTEAAA